MARWRTRGRLSSFGSSFSCLPELWGALRRVSELLNAGSACVCVCVCVKSAPPPPRPSFRDVRAYCVPKHAQHSAYHMSLHFRALQRHRDMRHHLVQDARGGLWVQRQQRSGWRHAFGKVCGADSPLGEGRPPAAFQGPWPQEDAQTLPRISDAEAAPLLRHRPKLALYRGVRRLTALPTMMIWHLAGFKCTPAKRLASRKIDAKSLGKHTFPRRTAVSSAHWRDIPPSAEWREDCDRLPMGSIALTNSAPESGHPCPDAAGHLAKHVDPAHAQEQDHVGVGGVHNSHRCLGHSPQSQNNACPSSSHRRERRSNVTQQG